MPTLALTNNIAFHSLSDKDKTFPVVRVFGTIGWIVAGIFIGVTGISDTTGIFTLAAIISVILALYSLTLPNTPAPAKGLPVKVRDLFCADAFALLKVRHFFVFSLCATLISVPLGTYYAYTASFLADAGVGDVSTAMSFGQMSEIFFMLVIPFLFRRLGVKYMLLIGMCAWFVRYAFFALGISEEGRFLLYLGILLHGVCYDFFFVVGFIYTDRIAGEKVKGQAQSMIVMFTYGIGMLLGSQISGALYNRLVAGQTVPQAWTTFWWIPAVAAAVIAVIFLFSFKYDDKEQA
jgi:nucleoside transporter